MSVYEKVKAELARKAVEAEQELETRRRNFDMVFSKIVPRLENYFNKECDSLIRDGGRATVSSVLESPIRSLTTFVFSLPYEGHGSAPAHTYRVIVAADRLCIAEAKALQEDLGSIDAPDFLIKLDKSFAKMLELVMRDA
ncbi:hypothetical protein D9O50_01615 [Oxalobacteraceae bacterium CAVE-383]|nr:hypothetical protein D9O50_01615 [Oxalobacteraceae bacterium CAVE-383]